VTFQNADGPTGPSTLRFLKRRKSQYIGSKTFEVKKAEGSSLVKPMPEDTSRGTDSSNLNTLALPTFLTSKISATACKGKGNFEKRRS
jgi:hypothetical protein